MMRAMSTTTRDSQQIERTLIESFLPLTEDDNISGVRWLSNGKRNANP
jgi:hypothetical protein